MTATKTPITDAEEFLLGSDYADKMRGNTKSAHYAVVPANVSRQLEAENAALRGQLEEQTKLANLWNAAFHERGETVAEAESDLADLRERLAKARQEQVERDAHLCLLVARRWDAQNETTLGNVARNCAFEIETHAKYWPTGRVAIDAAKEKP